VRRFVKACLIRPCGDNQPHKISQPLLSIRAQANPNRTGEPLLPGGVASGVGQGGDVCSAPSGSVPHLLADGKS
jgi:hypothetical protein